MNPLNYMRLHDTSSENSRQCWTNALNGKIRRVLMEEHALGEAADREGLFQRLAVLRQARRLRGAAGHEPGRTKIGMAAETLRAIAAEAGEAGHHVVTRPYGGDVFAHCFNNASTLVAEDL